MQKMDEREFIEKHVAFVWCECGEGIPLVSDLRAMSDAIEKHAAEHGHTEKDPFKALAAAKRVRELLIKQVFEEASK